MMTQLLYLGLRKIKQPRVISEILGGILLGPTAFGRIPGFTNHIFPAASIPYLTLVANIGLCLFLFIIGLEIDASIIRRNARLSVVVSLAGILLPFGVGAAISKPLYEHFSDSSVHYPYFMLFVGVSYSITAFPVLCRILTELQLLDTTVGLIVLSAGVANDVVAWTRPVDLPRLCGVRVVPTLPMFYMTVVMIVLWASSFFTDIVGVNAIFGEFSSHMHMPTFMSRMTNVMAPNIPVEKLEDMVSIIFLPLVGAVNFIPWLVLFHLPHSISLFPV